MTLDNFNVWGPLAFGVYGLGLFASLYLVEWWERWRAARSEARKTPQD